MMKKTAFALLAALLVLLAFSGAALGEGIALSDATEQKIAQLENGPLYLPMGEYRNSYSFGVELKDDVPVTSVTLEWVSGVNAMRNYFSVEKNGYYYLGTLKDVYVIQANRDWYNEGTSTFCLTVEAESGSLTRNITVNVSRLSNPPRLLQNTATVAVNEEADLDALDFLSNPGGFATRYHVAPNSGSAYCDSHSYKDKDGERFTLERRYIPARQDYGTFFLAQEAGKYSANVDINVGVNLQGSFFFDIEAVGTEPEPEPLAFSQSTLQGFQRIEDGPIYSPANGYFTSGSFEITLADNKTVDSVKLAWLYGNPQLKDMFVLGKKYGSWYVSYASSSYGAGTARFSVTAFSGEDSVSQEFAVTVLEPDLTKLAAQLKTVVNAEVNVPLDLTQAGILGNDEYCRAYYKLIVDNEGYSSHESQDEDGQRFSLRYNGLFTAGEAGTYQAAVQAEYSVMKAIFYFDIEVTDTGIEPPGDPLPENVQLVLQEIENGPIYMPVDRYSSSRRYDITPEFGLEIDYFEVEWLDGEPLLRNMFEIDQDDGRWYLGFANVFEETGSATFRLTAVSFDGSASQVFTASVSDPDPATLPSQLKTAVYTKVNTPLDLTLAGIIDNPEQYPVKYSLFDGNDWVAFHIIEENEEGQRYSFDQDGYFRSHEAGDYTAVARLDYGVNLVSYFAFTIVVTDTVPEPPAPPAISFADFTLTSLQGIENGPIYMPVDNYWNSGLYEIALEDGGVIDSVQVEWLEGEPLLSNMFVIVQSDGRWDLGFADAFQGTGSARFRLTAVSGESSVSQEFTATIWEADLTNIPAQQKTAVYTEVNAPLDLNQAGILYNPEQRWEEYWLYDENGWNLSHTWQDADGQRYTFGEDGIFTAGEAGTYGAKVVTGYAFNLVGEFYFDIVVTEAEPEPPAISFPAIVLSSLQQIEDGPIYMPANGYANSVWFNIELEDGRTIDSLQVEWLEGEELLNDMFVIEHIDRWWSLGFADTFQGTGSARFRLTAVSGESSVSQEFNATVLEPDLTKIPALQKTAVYTDVNAVLDLTQAGILYNPEQWRELYLLYDEDYFYFSHTWQDADGERYTFGEDGVFTAEEAGTYSAKVITNYGVNLVGNLYFDLVVTDAEPEPPAISFSQKTLRWFERIENGPIYMPAGEYHNSPFYDITLENGSAVDSIQVEWLGGEPLLQNMFVTEQHGDWYFGFAETFGGTGSARFRLTAFSGKSSVSQEFTVTVSEPDQSKFPAQMKTEVHTQVNATLDLTRAGIVQNPDHWQESYRLKDGYSWVYSHTSRDEDGHRYTFGYNGSISYAFTAEEAGTYHALVRVSYGVNLLSTFYFDIIAEDTGSEPQPLNFSSDFLYSLAAIEAGPIYLPFDEFRGDVYVYDIYLKNNVMPDTATVEWVSGDEALKNLYFTQKTNRWMLKYNRDYGGVGTAVFRVTATLGTQSVSKEFTATVSELEASERPTQNLTAVSATVGKPLTLQTLGIVTNPAGFEEVYMARTSRGWAAGHQPEDADGLRYSLDWDSQGNSVFTANEAGTYQAFVQVKPSYNLTATYDFTIEAVEPSAISFTNDTLDRLQNIEDGPIYRPVNGYTNSRVYFIALEKGRKIDSLQVTRLNGEPLLEDMFVVMQDSGQWYLCFADTFQGTGSARFRLTAVSGQDSVSYEFTATVTELDAAELPAQILTDVTAAVGQPLTLQTAGVVTNPADYQITYWFKTGTGWSLEHEPEDADGLRYSLVQDSQGNSVFTANEAGTYLAFIQVKPHYNLTAAFNFTITVTEAETVDAVLSPSGIGSTRTFVAEAAAEWSSSDPAVCTVDQGKVTAAGKGAAVVQARSASGAVLLTVNVTVRDMRTFVLPSGLKQLEAEALSGVGAERIILPDTIQIIAESAFADNPQLLVIYIPSGALTESRPHLNDSAVIYTDGPVSGLPVEIVN